MEKYLEQLKALTVNEILVIGLLALIFLMMIVVSVKLSSIARVGKKIRKSIDKASANSGQTSARVIQGYIKAIKKEQPIVVNVQAPATTVATPVAEGQTVAEEKPQYEPWTGYDPIEEPQEEVVEETPVEEVVEETPVEEVVEEQPEEVVEEQPEEVVEEVVEEPQEEVVEEQPEEVVEEPQEEVVEEQPEEQPEEDPALAGFNGEKLDLDEDKPEEQQPEGEVDEEGNFVSINKVLIPKKSHAEKYAELDEESKKYYDAVMAYAESKADVKRQESINADTVFFGRTCIVKTQIKQTKVVCSFSMLDADMKRMFKGNKGVNAKEKFTTIRVSDPVSLEMAKQSIDFSYQSAVEEKEYKHQQQLQKRRDARKAKKEAAEGADAE